MRIAILGVGGVGGLLAGALDRAAHQVTVIARASTAAAIANRGIEIDSVRLGRFTAHPQVSERLTEPFEVLIIATKATTLQDALGRIAREPGIVLPLLNGLDHLTMLRQHFANVLAGAIRVESDRPGPGVIRHTSPFLRIDMACPHPVTEPLARQLADTLEHSGIPTRVCESEAQVMWGKLVRLNALACTTAARDKLLGEIRATPQLNDELLALIREGCAVAGAEGAVIDPSEPTAELTAAHATLGSSMQRDIAAGRTPELDAIPGAVLRAGARHGIACPTTERLAAMIAERVGVPSLQVD